METIEPYINGTPLTDIGAYADVRYSENWQRGCDTAGWSMNPWTRDRLLYAGATVVLKTGPTERWTGLLSQPSVDGTFTAYGMAASGDGVKAIDGSNAATRDPQVAVAAAIARGAVPWKLRATGNIGAVVPGDVDVATTLNQLLDQHTGYTGYRWRVDHQGIITDLNPPTAPRWGVHVNRDLWTMATDNYTTHLNVTYFDTTLTFLTFQATTADSANAAVRWRRVERDLDLSDKGILSLAEAQAFAAQVLAKTGPRMQLTDPVVVGPGQLRTIGDSEAGWVGVHAGQMVRLWGVPDRGSMTPTLHTDVTIGRIEVTRSTLTMTPAGAEVQTFEDVIAELFGGTS